MEIAEKVITGDVRAAARLISGIEQENPEALAELEKIYPYTGKAAVIGVTGAPGIGKSSLISSLTGVLRKNNLTVGISAVDPSSPLTGGAILGDRIRMQAHAADKGVFVRSLAARGHAGGLAGITLATIHIMDAMGKDYILVETVGTGQNEVDISHVADTVVLMLSPESGDDIQLMKAGIMEIADIFVINKADKGSAECIAAEVEAMLNMKQYAGDGWKPPVIITDAVSCKGIDTLTGEIIRHKRFLTGSGQLAKRRENRARYELQANLEKQIADYFHRNAENDILNQSVADVAAGKKSPHAAVKDIIKAFLKEYQQE
jgi:LAO/AO transport system kinase